MIALGFLTVLFLLRRDAPKHLGISPDAVNEMGFWILLTGLAGTRLLHILLYSRQYSLSDPLGWVAIWNGGLVFQGAIPPAFVYYYFAAHRRGVPFWRGLDVALSYVPLGHAFGRVGCFMYGCCYGREAHVPWGVSFPAGSPAWSEPELQDVVHQCTVPLHPTQLYSVAGLLAIFTILMLARRRGLPFDGLAAALYFMLYGAFRFVVEIYRADNKPGSIGFHILSDQQMFALGMILAGAVFSLVLWRYMPRNRPEERGNA